MTNTKFRRRALISSVAMLLVAMLALGSATFAWFAADPTAKTKGLDLKARSSVGLLIQSETEQNVDSTWWSHEALLNAKSKTGSTWTANDAVTIGAASVCADSSTNKGTVYTVEADKDNNYAGKPTGDVTVATKGTDYYGEKLYLKVTGNESKSVDLTGVTLTNTGTNLAKGIRVAVTKSDGTVLGVWKPSNGTNNKYLMKEGKYNASGVVSSGNYTAKDSGALASGSEISIGTIGTTGSDYVNVIVYLDGEDENVYSLGIGSADLTSIFSKLVVSFEIHEA